MNINRINFQRFIDRKVTPYPDINKEGRKYTIDYEFELPKPYKNRNMDKYNEFARSLVARAGLTDMLVEKYDLPNAMAISDVFDVTMKRKVEVNFETNSVKALGVSVVATNKENENERFENELALYESEYFGLDEFFTDAEKRLDAIKIAFVVDKNNLFKDGNIMEQFKAMREAKETDKKKNGDTYDDEGEQRESRDNVDHFAYEPEEDDPDYLFDFDEYERD